MKRTYLLIAIMVISSFSCGSASMGIRHGFSYGGEIIPGRWLRNIRVPYKYEDKTGIVRVQIFFPSGYRRGANLRTLIVLHGYAQNLRDWEKNTPIETYANQHDFILVCPDMGRSMYESRFYPETTSAWNRVPGSLFIGKILLQYIRQTFNIAYERERTGIFGLSTGGRGALLVAALYNRDFGATAGLSGDYDPQSMTEDRLLTGVYGKYEENKERWKNDDNIMKLSPDLKGMPVFLSHGGKDSVVPRGQSVILAMKLKQLQRKYGGYEIIYSEKKHHSHNWRYWRSILPELMDFFNQALKK